MFTCVGYKIAIYDNMSTPEVEQVWNPWMSTPQQDPAECYAAQGYPYEDSSNPEDYGDRLEVCSIDAQGDLEDEDNPMIQPVLNACLAECYARPLPPQMVAAWVNPSTGETWRRYDEYCIVGPAASGLVPDEFGDGVGGGGTNDCSTGVYPKIEKMGDCGPLCPGSSEVCEDWKPESWVYSRVDRNGDLLSVVHDDFFESLNLSAMFTCDAQSYVYNEDGAGVATVDGLQVNDFLQRLGMVDGDSDFELRGKAGGVWGRWFPLNTFDELVDAFENVEQEDREWELRYDSITTSSRVTRTVTVKDCAAAGDAWRCDVRDI